MSKKTTEKVSFSKFFPGTQEYVVLRGIATSPTDFDLTLDIGDGENKARFYIGPWSEKSSVDMLRVMRDSMQQALDFYETALGLPMEDVKKANKSIWSMLGSGRDDDEEEIKPSPKKPAAKKKKAAAKK